MSGWEKIKNIKVKYLRDVQKIKRIGVGGVSIDDRTFRKLPFCKMGNRIYAGAD